MRYKRSLWLMMGLLTGMVVNSCKKDNPYTIKVLFSCVKCEFASVLVLNFTGSTQTSTDTLNTNWGLTQYFTFNTNGTCTYQNFDCVSQPTPSGTWSLTSNQLYLQSNIVCKDTTVSGSSMPFSNASIQNLGDYSLILLTGDIQPN